MPEALYFGMRLTPAEKRQIKQLARARGTSMKQAVLEAVQQHLDALPASTHGSSGSVLDGLDDVLGSAEGPADLSTNSDYLQGYGR